MKKFLIAGLLGLIAMFAFSGTAMAEGTCLQSPVKDTTKYATQAACEAMTPESPTGVWYLSPEWLVAGKALAAGEEPEVKTEGALLLADIKAPVVGTASVECEGILDGTVGPGGKDKITKVLTLAGVELGSELTGTSLKCKSVKGCEGTDAEVWPDKLPWTTQLELVEVGGKVFVVDDINEPGWHINNCLVFGLNTTDLCAGLTLALVENMLEGEANDLLANFVPGAPSPLVTCEVGGAESGESSSTNGLISTISGATLTVSGDGVAE